MDPLEYYVRPSFQPNNNVRPPVFSWMQKLHPACYVLSETETALSLSGIDMWHQWPPLLCQKLTLLCHCRELTWPLLCHCHRGVYFNKSQSSQLGCPAWWPDHISAGAWAGGGGVRRRDAGEEVDRLGGEAIAGQEKLLPSRQTSHLFNMRFCFLVLILISGLQGKEDEQEQVSKPTKEGLCWRHPEISLAILKSFFSKRVCLKLWRNWISVARRNSIYLFIFNIFNMFQFLTSLTLCFKDAKNCQFRPQPGWSENEEYESQAYTFW